jgi:hypothetical protein
LNAAITEKKGKSMDPEEEKKQDEEKNDRRLPICEKAPEWAEHHRLQDEDQPCEDGRGGNIFGRRKDDHPIPPEAKDEGG